MTEEGDDDAVVWVYDERGGVSRHGATISRSRNRMFKFEAHDSKPMKTERFSTWPGGFLHLQAFGGHGPSDPGSFRC